MLTVKELVDDLDLSLTAGEEGADAPIRWVHITELLDPTPWLSGGELLLTTGLQLKTAAEQRQFVKRLAHHHLCGLGFGTGFEHPHVPAALTKEARRLGFPLFEVPYEMPFIAITENAFGKLVNEQYEVLQRGIAIHKRLEQLVLEERGLEEMARALSAAIGGAVAVLDRRGQLVCRSEFQRRLSAAALGAIAEEIAQRSTVGSAATFAPDDQAVSGRALVLPVAGSGPEVPEAWLVAVRDSGGLADFERLILQQAVTVIALELMRRRVVRDTERRLAGDILEEILSGTVEGRELEIRLRPFGIAEEAAVLVFELDDPVSAQAVLEGVLLNAGAHALVAAREGLLYGVIEPEENDLMEIAEQARTTLEERFGETRAAVSRLSPSTQLKRSFYEARCALEVSSLADGHSARLASYRDLGAMQLLLSVQDPEALELYCENVLGPIANGEGEYGEELLRSLGAFLEQNGHWARAARQLDCHRHTLRYRIRRIEELTGRDLGRARDRIEFWLALRARELVGT